MGKGARGFLRAQAGASTAFPSAIKVMEGEEVGQAGPVTKPVCDLFVLLVPCDHTPGDLLQDLPQLPAQPDRPGPPGSS